MADLKEWLITIAQGLVLALPGALFTGEVAAQPAARQDKVFAGDARCTRCHGEDDDYPVLDIAKTHHGGAARAGVTSMTCTSCHGESERHVNRPPEAKERPKPDVVFGKKGARIPAETRSKACLSCHESNRHLAFWDSGRHKKNDVACDSCHVVHQAKSPPLRKDNPSITPFVTTSRQLEYETCTTCHRDIRAQIHRPSHHPLIEGKIKCSSCHNPHGALSPNMVNNDSIRDLCVSCHADKRGPFIFEHPPVEENCLSCHNPHGSRSVKLLREKVPNLCQDCHDASQHPGTAWDPGDAFTGATPSTRFLARACLNCHNEIHGSNGPASRGRRFVR